MVKKMLMLLMIIVVFAAICYAEEAGSMNKLLKAKYIKIYWDKGIFTTWEKGWPWEGYPKTKNGKWSQNRNSSWVIIDRIDPKNGKAKIEGWNEGTVSVVPGSEGLNFIEFSGGGNISVITVLPYLDKSGKYVAVMSRHLNALPMKRPIVSQWYGLVEEIR
jgi:hypothetical protein